MANIDDINLDSSRVNKLSSILEIPKNSSVAIFGYGEFGKKIKKTIEILRKDIKIQCIGDDNLGNSVVDGVKIVSFTDFCSLVKQDELFTIIGAYGDLIVNKISEKLSDAGISSYFLSDILRYEHNCLMLDGGMWNGFFEMQGFTDDELSKYKHQITVASEIFDTENKNKYLELIEARRIPNLKNGRYLLDNNQLVQKATQYYEFYDFRKIKTVVEGGMFDGYDVLKMIKLFPNVEKIYSFEPFLDHYNKFWGREFIENSHKSEIIPKALWDKQQQLNFVNAGCGSRPFNDKDSVQVDAISIDEFKKQYKIDKIDFIKLDVEGSEKNALLGALSTIKSDRPILAVSIYHSKQEMIELPILLSEICPNYTFKIGHYTYHFTETIVYAIPKEQS